MKIFVLGKLGSVVHWAEDSIAGFRAAGHDVRFGVTRNPRLNRSIERLLVARWAGAPRVARIVRAITRFAPDLILAVAPYHMPLAILRQVAALPGRAPLLGWVGDAFSAADAPAAAALDAVGYTDSGMLASHRQFGWPTPAIYLPHAANPRLDRGIPDPLSRHRDMVFVANPTPHRRALVAQMQIPMRLFGIGWTPSPATAHMIQARHIGIDELGAIYRSATAVLNVRNEHNVLNGLNQRHFDPYLAATPVVSDDLADVARCFDPGTEVLVYHDGGELNDLYARLRRDPGFAATVGERGRRRVLAEHTYAHRLTTLLKLT